MPQLRFWPFMGGRMVEAAYRVKFHIHPAMRPGKVPPPSLTPSVSPSRHSGQKKRGSPCGYGKRGPMRALPDART